MGSDPNSPLRYYYVYNGHGDVVALVDAQGNAAASYAYDAFGQLTLASENFGSGTSWTNPYRYDGRDGVRYDGETGLYWMSVRAYDPALGRFLSRDPLGRAPLFFADQPYVYAGNNPLINVDPSGQFMATEGISNAQAHVMMKRVMTRIYTQPHWPGYKGTYAQCQRWAGYQRDHEKGLRIAISALELGMAVGLLAFDIYGFLHSNDGVFKKVGRLISAIADFVSGMSALIDLVGELTGANLGGVRRILDLAAVGVNAVAGLYRAIENGLGWLFEGGFEKAASFAINVWENLNWIGLILLVGSLITHIDVDSGREVFRHLFMAALGVLTYDLDTTEDQSIDQYCHANSCSGY